MADLTREQVVDYLSNLPVIHWPNLIRTSKTSGRQGGSRGRCVGGGGPRGGCCAGRGETEFTVELAGRRCQQDQRHQGRREITGLGLKEAKDLVEAAAILKDALPPTPRFLRLLQSRPVISRTTLMT